MINLQGMTHQNKKKTSWEPVNKWYQKTVGDDGHYFHRKIVLPGVFRLLNLENCRKPEILDLACGEGVLGRQIDEGIPYTGIDLSSSLIASAKKKDLSPKHRYIHADVTKPLPLEKKDFSHATIILALQNIEHPEKAIKNAALFLRKEGTLIMVLNHPCFRIPRQSSWHVDEEKKCQYRRIDRYLSPLVIPIQAHPSKGEKSYETFSFHHPLSTYTQFLKESGFLIQEMEEWCSDKESVGGKAKMENRAREEFPLFLTIVAKKLF